MAELTEHTILLNGVPATVQLDAADAERLGVHTGEPEPDPVTETAKESGEKAGVAAGEGAGGKGGHRPVNKARTAENKGS